MRPVDMTQFHGPGVMGDCMRACVASIIGVDPLVLPPPLPTESLVLELDRALRVWGRALVWLAWDGSYIPDGVLHLMGGPGPRGVGHCVVAAGGELVHDPHPSRAGLSGPPDTIGLIVEASRG